MCEVINTMLVAGDVVRGRATRRQFRVVRILGEGGQGVVFEALDEGGVGHAIKWYYPHTATEQQRAGLAVLIERGAPSERFLWPNELVDSPDHHSFGYVMPLRPERYAGLSDLLVGRVDVSFRSVCALCFDLAHGFLLLHAEGLCYRDISFGNVFFDPQSGAPLVCDNDNIGVDGEGPVTVLGTRRFMAPEIIRREAVPSTDTDLYSLSVLLFYILMMGHPLMGRRELDFECWDDDAESMLFGKDPRFIFDPADQRNAPVPELHSSVLRYWPLYPAFIQEHFVKAFTLGLRGATNSRVRESVWRLAFARLHSCIIDCPVCGRENFIRESGTTHCWACSEVVTPAGTVKLGDIEIRLGRGCRLTAHHLYRNFDVHDLIAIGVAHPVRTDLVGLQNRSQRAWTVTTSDGAVHPVAAGQSVRIEPGTAIDFGTGSVTIT